MSDELYPEAGEHFPNGDPLWQYRLERRAADLYDLVRRALANPESWVEWQREAIAVVDHIEGRKG